jgi:hypothetical protein
MIKIDTTPVSKYQLLDYVTKREFNDFVAEMRDFREITESKFNLIDKRFDGIDKRFNNIDRRFDELKEDIRIQIGAALEQFRDDLKVGLEYIQNVEKTKVDQEEFDQLKIKVEKILHG